MGASLSFLTPVSTATAFVAAIATASYLLPSNTDSSLVKSSLTLAHLGSFSFAFGIQIWMSFVNGLTIIKILPRYTFGNVQRKLFDKYFLSGFVLNGIMMSTFLTKHPLSTWEGESLYMGSSLVVSSLVSAANIFLVKDIVDASMDGMYEYEKEHELTDADGTLKSEDWRKNVDYMVIRKKFYRAHGLSSVNNLIGMAASAIQLWYLSRNLNL